MRRIGRAGRRRWFIIRPATGWERLGAAVLLFAGGVVLVLLALKHPTDVPGLPVCPSKTFLGLECPGCGTGRGLHHLLQGRLADAWRHNPALLLLGLPALLLGGLDAGATLLAGRRVSPNISARAGLILAVLLGLYMIARNLPGERFDGWRPPDVLFRD